MRVTEQYTAALILSEGRYEKVARKRVQEIEVKIEVPKPWIPGVRVSENIIKRATA